MQVVSFDTAEDIPIIDAVVKGSRDFHRVRLVFDTGTGLTQLDTELVESLGYSAKDGLEHIFMTTAAGEEVEGYSLRIGNLSVLGKSFRDVRIGAFDFTHYGRYRIDGLLGWDLIKTLDLEMCGQAGVLKIF
jgi:predicted aspartyl protease